MGYTALYRKFRPAVFDDVKGQEHIVTTLRNQLLSNRIGHAYLFCGTRGTGKTTVAKILARAVNCESLLEDGSPCGECAMCRAISEGRSLNVIEIDAASNNGVDNVREIIGELEYPPVEGKYKVYVMDEAHMLSIGASNALLKTLEEPPSYAIFILATTDPAKLPITILSRCQRYDFRRISIDTIAARMKELVTEEGIEAEDRAIAYVAKAADGSMRDGLSLLDRCIAFNYGHTLTYDRVLNILGAVDTEVFSRLIRIIVSGDISAAMKLIEEVVMQGRELNQFVADLIWYMRNIMLLKASDGGDMEELLNVSSEHLELLKEEAKQLEMSEILRYINVFSELSQQMRYSTQKRIVLEMYLVRIMRPQMDTDLSALLQRVKQLEKQIEDGICVSAVMPAAAAEPVVELERAVPEDIKKIVREWQIIVGKSDNLLKAILNEAKLSLGDGDRLFICLGDGFKIKTMNEHRDEVQALLNEHTGRDVPFEIMSFDTKRRFDTQYADLKKLVHINIEEE